MKNLAISVLAFAAVVCCSGIEAQSEPIRMVLSCQSTRALTVGFENVGTEDTALVIGMTLGNGRRYMVNGLVLQLKREDGGAAEIFRYSPQDYPGAIGGRVDDWIVPLPVRTSFQLKLDSSQFWSEQFQRPDSLPLKSKASLRLPVRAASPGTDLLGLKFLRIWTGSGTLTSNEISVPEDCR
ncbi:MAG: hypothetical protein ABIS06_11045 [Vicinamibacterales bacterium]